MTLAFTTTLLLALVAGCGKSENDAPPPQAVTPPKPPAAAPIPPWAGMNENCELALFYKLELEKSRLRYNENHPEVARLRELVEAAEAACSGSAAQDERSGQWVQRGGKIVCDGYLTRFDDQDYCSAEVPEDWRPFVFDGELYYLQPLDSAEPVQSSRHSRHEHPTAPRGPAGQNGAD